MVNKILQRGSQLGITVDITAMRLLGNNLDLPRKLRVAIYAAVCGFIQCTTDNVKI